MPGTVPHADERWMNVQIQPQSAFMLDSPPVVTVRVVRHPLRQETSPMFERFHRNSAKATIAALLAALGVGGVAVAQSAGSTQPPTKSVTPAAAPGVTSSSSKTAETPGQESNAPENSAADPDNVQQGDQTEPKGSASEQESATETGSATETESASEQESGSEKVADDGPGGHADEPGNPNADPQATVAK
jgi:hypothetical protein